MNKQTNRESREDLFDHLIQLPVLRIFEGFYRTHKEVLLYLLFGGISFFLNVILFALIEHMFQISELINNVIGWVVCVLFQFVTNRTWVFAARTDGMSPGSFYFMATVEYHGGKSGGADHCYIVELSAEQVLGIYKINLYMRFVYMFKWRGNILFTLFHCKAVLASG